MAMTVPAGIRRAQVTAVLATVAVAVLVALTIPAGALADGVVEPPSVSDQALSKLREYSSRDIYNVVNGTASPESFTLGDKPVEQWGDYAVFGTPEQYAAAAQSSRTAALIKAGRLARIVDVLGSTAGYITAGVAVAQVYDQAVKMTFPGQAALYKLISGQEWNPVGATATTWKWSPSYVAGNYRCPSASRSAADGNAAGTVKMPDGTVLTCAGGANTAIPGGSTAPRTGADQYFVLSNNASGDSYCESNYYSSSVYNAANYSAMMSNNVGTVIRVNASSSASDKCNDSSDYHTVVRLATFAQLQAAGVVMKDTDSAGYTAASRQGDSTAITPTGTGTDTEAQAAVDAFVPAPGQGADVQTDQQRAFTVWVVHELDPAWSPTPTYFELPAPERNETYSDYITRLQGLGYVGTVTQVAESSAVDGYGPSAVTRVIATPYKLTTTRVYDPLAWPAVEPRIDPASGLTVRYNPSDVTPVPDDPNGGDGGSGGGGGGVDLGPISNLGHDVCKFPFGVLCWAHDAIATVSAPAQAPGIDWVMPAIDTPVAHLDMGQHYTVELSFFDDYMNTIRTVESWVMWIGAVWYVGSRMIGIRSGGDPTDGLDEAFNDFIH